ncbi:hypothetical protein Tco_0630021 [Tanacetum coccineum]
MAEMFGLLKELTSSRTPKKVLVREEAIHSITKNVNAIFIIKMENEKGAKGVKVAERNVMKLKELDALGPIESVDKGEGTDSRTVKDMQEEITKGETKAEVLLEIPSIGGVKYVNALINQGSDVKVMPMSSYNRLTSEEPAGTDIDFVKVLAFPSEIEERTDEDLDPVTPTNTVSRMVLEWEKESNSTKRKKWSLTNRGVKCLPMNVPHS